MGKEQKSWQQQTFPVNINGELFARVRAAAFRKHLTISQYLEELLDEMVPEMNEVIEPGHPLTQENLDAIRKIREGISKNHNYQSLGNSVEELRESREERLQQLLGG